MYTAYQRGYLAYWLSIEGKAEKSLTQTIASAKVDMNKPWTYLVIPHDSITLGRTLANLKVECSLLF